MLNLLEWDGIVARNEHAWLPLAEWSGLFCACKSRWLFEKGFEGVFLRSRFTVSTFAAREGP